MPGCPILLVPGVGRKQGGNTGPQPAAFVSGYAFRHTEMTPARSALLGFGRARVPPGHARGTEPPAFASQGKPSTHAKTASLTDALNLLLNCPMPFPPRGRCQLRDSDERIPALLRGELIRGGGHRQGGASSR